MIKLTVFDIDGTLINDNGNLQQGTTSAIKSCYDNNMKFAIASGRAPAGVMHIIDKYELSEYIQYAICYNGTVIYDCKTNIACNAPDNNISFYDAMNIIKILDMAGINTSKTYFVTDKGIYNYIMLNKYARAEADKNDFNILYSKNQFDKIYKIVISGTSLKLKHDIKKLPKSIYDNYNAYYASPNNFEIYSKHIDKGYGICELAKLLQINIKDVAAVGDSYNDIPMLKMAGTGIAMGNAEKTVKQISDCITHSNNSDGIVYALQKFI